jgi:hypothetical protein
MAEIAKARFLVVDVTLARAAVYFEAGYAQGLRIPIIWTCRASNAADMCFDTRQHEHVLWHDSTELQARLAALIRTRGWQITKS